MDVSLQTKKEKTRYENLEFKTSKNMINHYFAQQIF